MAHILSRPLVLVVTTLSLSLSAGCSGTFGSPYDQANGYVTEANEAIDEHNRLFEEARGTYEAAKEAVESGEDTSQAVDGITEARETIQEARGELERAREPLTEIQDLDVETQIKEYAVLLSEAIDAQIAAENREMRFYEILEQDPTLTDNRAEAEETLTEVGDGYEEAQNSYNQAQELANANPDLLKES
jgi:hypothetical protein